MTVSVCTLTHGRDVHLDNLIRGLEASTLAPAELIIVHMNESIGHQTSSTFTVRSVRVDAPHLPLAAARNLAAHAASGSQLIFLDVDCVPAPTLVAHYAQALAAEPRGVWMGEVRYLPQPLTAPWHFDSLRGQARVHAARPSGLAPGEVRPTDEHHLFWSLNFALGRAVFEAVQFDEQFTGYGGEDTDFALALAAAGVPFFWLGGAEALHQPHFACSPPLQHFADTIANARRFYRKWGRWPMAGWLERFAELGLIEWRATELTVVRHPTTEEIAAHRTYG